ncbi:hypothetical protein OAD22_11315 [Pseudomonadales bacterium]|nr:hypothetical protein [Pseudomonadales bacterium]MDA9315740.1 hypothetical protein [Pseudomonadales bacterium]MDB4150722.1 hypothetical protein [Pseudomonadales bacterium]MDB9867960.1 hypothetical protein [Pseudomonadales bacterium]MDB9880322.1 hypothetical protein [Pseudomonadales bacterium]
MHSPELSNLSAKPIGIEMSSMPRLQLNDLAARELGLRNGQFVRAVADAPGQLRLVNGQLNTLVASTLPAEVGQVLNFRYVVSIYGRYLQQVASDSVQQSAKQAAAPTPAGNPLAASLLVRASDAGSSFLGAFGVAEVSKWMGLAGRPDLQQQLSRLRISPDNISPDTIKLGLIKSGLFTEALLRVQVSDGKNLDFKQILITLQRSLRQSSPAAATGISRLVEVLEGNQVEALAADGRKDLFWRFLLPFGESNLIQLEIESQQDSPGSEGRLWSVYLETDFQELDHLAVKSVLTSSGHVDITIWAVKPETLKLVQSMIADLRYELASKDLSIDALHVVLGRRVLRENQNVPGDLMDVRT